MLILPRHTIVFLFVSVFLITVFPQQTQAVPNESRGLRVKLKTPAGKDESVPLYKGSYALLFGVSKYNAGWPVLESIPREIDRVEEVLADRGFKVVKVIDPTAEQLESNFRDFINTYGLARENRLLFFFSGHGYTRDDGRKGYLVPIDAPDPDRDLSGFLQKALGMNQILSWARDIESKHALFLFDSCFSGTIFKQKSRPEPPRHITRLTIEPVRQFITAGSAGEEVPANSTFTPVFIDGLRYGLADLNRDGYVSATELGLYLQSEVPAHANQNPQFGKIRDYELSRGDFIFMTDATLNAEYPDIKRKERYDSRSKLGILKVESSPVGASVYIDNGYKGITPLTLDDVAPGPYSIRVEKAGFRTESRQIQVTGGRMVTADFPLLDVVSRGTLTVKTNPKDAEVRIVETGARYLAKTNLAEGTYHIEISKDGYATEKHKVQLAYNEDLILNITLRKIDSQTAEVPRQAPPEKKVEKTKQSNAPRPPAAQKDVPQEIAQYIQKLRSAKSADRRNAAVEIARKKLTHPTLMAVVEQELLDNHTRNTDDRYHIDALAWMCKILASTNNGAYRTALRTVSRANTNEKLKKYAAASEAKLRKAPVLPTAIATKNVAPPVTPKQIAPRNNRVTHSSTENEPPVAATSLKVAFFPFRLLDAAGLMTAILTNDVVNVIAEKKCLQLSHSYYQLSSKLNVKEISDDASLSYEPFMRFLGFQDNNMWDGSAPDAENVSKVGKAMGADVVLIGSIRVKNTYSDLFELGYIRIFFVDTKSKKIIKARNKLSFGNARDALRGIIYDAASQYAEEFCRQ